MKRKLALKVSSGRMSSEKKLGNSISSVWNAEMHALTLGWPVPLSDSSRKNLEALPDVNEIISSQAQANEPNRT